MTEDLKQDDGKRPRTLFGSIVIDTKPFQIPAFRRLWTSGAVTAIGSQLTAVAVPKQIYDLTGSSGYVGLTGAAALLPLLVFGLWGGAIADAMDRRKLLLITNTGVAATSILLWAQAFLQFRSVWVVLGLLAVNQAFFAVNMPTRSAMVARLVPTGQIPSAVALNTTMMHFGAVLGPLAAAAMMPFIGLSTLYLLDAVALTLAVWAVWRLPAMAPSAEASGKAGLSDIWDGLRYLVTQKILLASFLLDLIAMIAGMPRALFPEMAEKTFGDPVGGGIALGLLYAAIPIGSFVCGLGSGWLGNVRRQGAVTAIAVAAWGASVIGFGMSSTITVAVFFLILGGAADFISMVMRGAIMQTATTDHMRGRLQGVFTVVVAGGPRVADLTHGWTAAIAGTTVAATGGGVLVVVLTLVSVVALPAFWRYRVSAAETVVR
ncbi:MFS transporter [Stackebrandtia soli]|uniref:MFS transporter n=1 Tax=Stackebrandtia soli TaxID=1892856 RepID=UPI0039EA05D2